MQTHLTPRRAGHRNPFDLVLTTLLAGLLLAQPILADADPPADSEPSAESVSDASDAAEGSDASDADEAAPDATASSESRTMEILNKTFDVVALRPAQALMTGVGAVLFVPVAIMASPGGRDSIEEALDRFVMIPAESAFQRPLGEF